MLAAAISDMEVEETCLIGEVENTLESVKPNRDLGEKRLQTETTEQESATKETELNNDTVPEDQGSHSKWQCVENLHTMRLRLQRVKPSPQQKESLDESADYSDIDPDFHYTSSPNSENTSESSGLEENENIITNKTEGAESDNTQTDNKRKGKKRKANPVEWKKTKAKFLRNSGKPYTSSSIRKTEMQARKVRPACGEKCKLKCSSKIEENKRLEIFENYWSLESLKSHREFISRSMTAVRPQYQYKKEGSRRQCNHAFHFVINEVNVRVCKFFFMATLDINNRVIRTVVTKLNEGFLQEDLRGKHGHHFKVDSAIKDGVVAHINTIPRIDSHYLRAQTTREFIEGGKSLADLHRDYKNECIEKNLPFANLTMYSRIFNTNFNISFFTPKKDQCDLCSSYNNARVEEREAIQEKYDKHLKEKVLSRAEKEEDKKKAKESEGKIIVATYDLQAVLPAPRGDTSTFYYKSKINSYNLTINELQSDKVECFFWHEGQGNRGAIEIGTCILKYLEEKANTRNDDNLEIVLYSDNCCGQQKNKFIMGMYLYAVQKFKIKSITHKFLIRGHTQNEGDNVHSVIEKSIKRALKSGPIYIPTDYVRLIRSAKKTGNPYKVTELSYEDFVDLKKLSEQIGSNFNKTSNNEQIKTSELKVFKVQKTDPGIIFVKTTYEQKDYGQINVNNTRRRQESISTIKCVPAYKKKMEISAIKKAHIKSLISAKSIPTLYKPIYDSMFV